MYRPSLDCIDVAGCSSARVYHQNTVGENCDFQALYAPDQNRSLLVRLSDMHLLIT